MGFRPRRDYREPREPREPGGPRRTHLDDQTRTHSPPVEMHGPKSVKISADEIVQCAHWFGTVHANESVPHGYHLEEMFDDYSRSSQKELPQSMGEFLYGLHCVHSALARDRRTIYGLLTDKSPSELEQLSPLHAVLVERCKERQVPIIVTKTGRLEQLSGGFGNRHNSAILICSA